MSKHKAVKPPKRLRRNVALLFVVLLVLSLGGATQASSSDKPFLALNGKHSGIYKSSSAQYITPNKWTNFKLPNRGAFDLNGKRTLFFAQLHLRCKKSPKFVKIRLARHLPDGTQDTTGTNTWVTNPIPRTWQGSLWWESKTKDPITAQFYVAGGKCFSPQRQFKWWQP